MKKSLKIPDPKKLPTKLDEAGSQEAEGMDDDLEKIARRNQHKRDEKQKHYRWWTTMVITTIVIAGIGVMAIIWFIHLVIPSWRWLDFEGLSALKHILFSSVISTILSPFIQKNLST